MKNEAFITVICPVIGRTFLIVESDPDVYDLETHTNTVEFDSTMLGLASLNHIRGKFLIEQSDPQFKGMVWMGIALVKGEAEELGVYYYDSFDGTQNETLLLIGMDLCEKILQKLNQPNWDELGIDADNTLWAYMDEVDGPLDYFQRCKQAVCDRLMVQRYCDKRDLAFALTTLKTLEFGPWVAR